MMNRIRVPIPRERIEDFCRRWMIREFSLFGSAVRDDFSPESDVDVLITFDPDAPWSTFEWVDMEDELKLIFGREVDLVEERALRNPFRRETILRDKTVVYAA